MSNHVNTFRSLHTPSRPLVLPNAWDAASARVFEAAGAAAVATTSAGVAWSHGYRDGNQLPVAAVHALAASLTRVVAIPVSIDFEAGYSDDPARVAEHVVPLLDCGVAGINLEDGTAPPELLERKIAAIRGAVARHGSDLFINARTDVYLQGLVPAGQRLEEAIARGNRYRAVGADGIFVPALASVEAIRAVVQRVALPLNLLAWQGLPALAELSQLGVSRLSAGSGLVQLVWGRAEAVAREFLSSGDSSLFAAGGKTHRELQSLFAADKA